MRHVVDITFENGNIAQVIIDDSAETPTFSVHGLNHVVGVGYICSED